MGAAIDSLADMETLFAGIPLDKISTSMTINAPAAVLLAMYIAVGEEQGVKPTQLNGTIQNDILKEYIARGTYIFPPQPSRRLITHIVELIKQKGMNDVLVIGGGVLPEADIPGLKQAGIAEIFTPGTSTASVVEFIKANAKGDRGKLA